jgi:hypothetical protein
MNAPNRGKRWSWRCPIQRLLAIQPLDPKGDDSLVDELLASNPRFQELVAKAKRSPRKPFLAGPGSLA